MMLRLINHNCGTQKSSLLQPLWKGKSPRSSAKIIRKKESLYICRNMRLARDFISWLVVFRLHIVLLIWFCIPISARQLLTSDSCAESYNLQLYVIGTPLQPADETRWKIINHAEIKLRNLSAICFISLCILPTQDFVCMVILWEPLKFYGVHNLVTLYHKNHRHSNGRVNNWSLGKPSNPQDKKVEEETSSLVCKWSHMSLIPKK